MKALVFKRYGKSRNIEFAEIQRPSPKQHEILVQVHAVGLNPIDNMIPRGVFKAVLHFALPAVMGSDVAGTVVAIGGGVTRFKIGDAVFASIFDLGTGALAEFAIVPERAAALKPDNLDFVQAASIPMVGLTSWQALKERAQVKAGQKVFIPAGSGGIGTFAIQLAKQLGARVGTTTSSANFGLVRSLGADEIVDYKKDKFEDVLVDYDVVLGTLRGDELKRSLRVLRPNSTVVSLTGPLDAEFGRSRRLNGFLVFVLRLMSMSLIRQARKRRASYSFLFVHPSGSQLAQIAALLGAGSIRPVIDKVFPFDQAMAALSYLETGRAKGKVVVQVR